MHLGLLTLDLTIAHAMSLKDRRSAISGLKSRLRQRFNVSVAEVGDKETWNRATLAVAGVGDDRAYVEGQLQRVVAFAEGHRDSDLEGSRIEWL